MVCSGYSSGFNNFDEAIKSYHEALNDPNYDLPARTLTNLADVYNRLGKQREARETLEAALKKPDPMGSDHVRAKMFLSILEAELKPEAMSTDDRALLEHPTPTREETGPEQRILTKIQTVEKSQFAV